MSQTLTTLNLSQNKIDAQGVEQLANALQQNKVTFLTSINLPYNYLLTIFIDTHNTASQWNRNRRSRRRTSCQCIATKQGNIPHFNRLTIQLIIHQNHRHSQRWTSLTTKSVHKTPNIWRMHCNKTR